MEALLLSQPPLLLLPALLLLRLDMSSSTESSTSCKEPLSPGLLDAGLLGGGRGGLPFWRDGLLEALPTALGGGGDLPFLEGLLDTAPASCLAREGLLEVPSALE